MVSAQTRKKNLKQIGFLAIAVLLVLAATLGFQHWWNQRNMREPQEVTINVSAPDQELEVSPYTVVEPGKPAEDHEIPTIRLGKDDSLKIVVPEDVADHDWTLLKIYDDPQANDEQAFGPHESSEASVPAQVKSEKLNANLVVVEVTSVMIGHDEQGEETPYRVTWSVHPEVK
ncbi:DUF2771 domain-containing protein [Corynebacterium gerontici]|uniref:DUF2771 domain-containing protein n=1 Tax=Corynebacterium gerontici TaxID=2079234 RepID=A0A3G6IZ87_9CORY|nr:DUF2771 domain-containing protein [Corynebacterium gerontici]AZA10966.1 hypothetical protein CGERO_03230 [Corynebacterium gerontici]